jgi:hypothetical protein
MRNLSITLILISVNFFSCVSDKVEGPVVSDATLFDLAQSVTSFTYFKNSLDTLRTDPAAAHSNYVRIRFNPKAREAMNSDVSGLTSPVFPDESMIVKEVYAVEGGPLIEFAIMYKLHNASNSASGWVWAEIFPDGTPVYSSSQKGDICTGCHSSGDHSDLVRTFALH